ncbi:MAG: amidohydrolase family protein [Pirellulaceae bacterium]
MMLDSRILSRCYWIGLAWVIAASGAWAQQSAAPNAQSTLSTRAETATEASTAPSAENEELQLRDFRPMAKLRVAENPRDHAKFPVVDVHTHLSYRLHDDPESLDAFVELMDRNQVAVCVSLDGRLGAPLQRHIEYLWSKYRDRFVIFMNIDWQGDGADDNPATWACNQPGFVRTTVMQMEAAAEAGVSGLKIFKGFGLSYRDAAGELLRIDDPRWDPIWETCGRLNLPVIMHVADPAAFFDPIDANNERWEELSRHPDWSFYGETFPAREELLDARNRVIARHSKTTFIGAHMANNSEDLATVSAWLDQYPNFVVEIASRIGELGRQPYTARDFLIKYSDRVMFGTDGPWPEKRYGLYWRFLETRDEYFPYSEKEFPPQGLWRIYGVHLPDQVLKKIYHQNAARLIPGVRERLRQRG